MPSLGDNNVNITIKTSANKTGITETESGLSSLKGKMGEMAGAFAIGNIAANAVQTGISKLGDVYHAFSDQMKEHEQNIAQTNAVLASTKGVAGVTADEVNQLADKFQKLTPIDGDVTMSAENMLLTFTEIHKNAFPAATKAALDMATAMNGGVVPNAQQVRNTALQLGIALNDPTQGMTRLHRVGVEFTAQQKEQIKTMQASGNIYGAQQVILKELAKEFGGSAANSAKTFSGQIQMLKNRIIDLGGAALEKMAKWLQNTFQWYERNHRVINDVMSVVIALGGAILTILTIYKLWQTAVKTVEIAQAALNLVMETNPIILILTAIIAVVLLLAMHWKQVKEVAVAVWHDIASVWGKVVGFFENIWHGIAGGLKSMGNFISAPFRAEFNIISDIWNATVGKLHFKIPSWVPGIGGKGFDMPNLPHFATGVRNFSGGLAMVGENGPEIAYLPQGSNVYPNGTKPQGMGGNTYQIQTLIVQAPNNATVATIFNSLDQDNINITKGLTPNRNLNRSLA